MRTSLWAASAVAAVVFVACDSSTIDGVCGEEGTGKIELRATGLPAGISGRVQATSLSSGGVATDLPVASARAGNYSIATPPLVAGRDPVVRTVYLPSVTSPVFCLSDGETHTVEVTYAPIASSGKLWVANANGSAELLGFPSSALRATGTATGAVVAKAPAGRAIAFDPFGNLWALGGTTADAPLARFAAGTLGTSGDKTPELGLTLPTPCLPAYASMAFDAQDNLWLTSACAKNVVRLSAVDVSTAGAKTPAQIVGNLAGPQGIAFDASGAMWVADSDALRIVGYDAARLEAPIPDGAPTRAIKAVTGTAADLPPGAVAFDAQGNLWATSFGGNVIYKLTKSELSGTGEATLTPGVILTLEVGALLEDIAFDEGGGLWVTYSQGKIARIAPSQLTTSTGAGAPTVPETIVTSSDLGSASGLAFYPAAANLPLRSRQP